MLLLVYGINKIAFNDAENYYQIVMESHTKNNLSVQPASIKYGIGLLSDDLEFVHKILINEEDWVPTAVSLGMFGAILRAIAEKKNNFDNGKYSITLDELSKLFKIHMEYLDMWENDIISFPKFHDTYVLVKDFNHPDTIYTLSKDTKLEYGSLAQEIKSLKRFSKTKITNLP